LEEVTETEERPRQRREARAPSRTPRRREAPAVEVRMTTG
jgi:hypothetical protein